jgi:hypothetical protein
MMGAAQATWQAGEFERTLECGVKVHDDAFPPRELPLPLPENGQSGLTIKRGSAA